jgi:hypothetical protein
MIDHNKHLHKNIKLFLSNNKTSSHNKIIHIKMKRFKTLHKEKIELKKLEQEKIG